MASPSKMALNNPAPVRAKAAVDGDIFSPATDIDRRGSKRVVPMEVLAMGLERTGTSSLRQALFILGYFNVYHMLSLLYENPKDQDLWCEAYDAVFEGKGVFGRDEWDMLLGHCMAVADLPCATFATQLIEAYPSAKIILQLRDSPEAWHRSILDTTYKIVVRQVGATWNPITHFIRTFAPMRQRHIWQRLARHDDYLNAPTNGIERYKKHADNVRRAARESFEKGMKTGKAGRGDLLEYNVKQGWEPLCKFLGKPIPDVPFPRVNDSAEFNQRIQDWGPRLLKRAAFNFASWVGLFAVVIGLVLSARKYLA